MLLHLRAQIRLAPRLRGKLDAADVVQETLLHALTKLGQFHGDTEAELIAWLLQILKTTLAMTARRFRLQARDVAREQPLEDEVPVATRRASAWPLDPVVHVLRGEQLQQLADALARLPTDQRRAIELHHLEGHSVKEVAVYLHKSRGAVAGMLGRGLKTLRLLLAEPKGG
jgi:RNA polymerase sigma-70 factor (ECF subfamily)